MISTNSRFAQIETDLPLVVIPIIPEGPQKIFIIEINKLICKYMRLENPILSLIMRPSQSVFTYSKLTIETLEQGVKYVQS